ncbi:transmembrane protein [Heterostelium album PN500]|uniref:Transmembrane protein n=1 Tax=Heterostelium pallidum (strain ATCC 26659 / Pp 5 / PN500) TaxID=670386 RepID=D3B016_HETP5|nr:transmembrane protein [Heterostelium album PN500]EFA84640.1 transmembrane protein [Heterostelium album PN500]|eukprot:XP_020436753.1 transmembrane protein [Heterostelium album PN500]
MTAQSKPNQIVEQISCKVIHPWSKSCTLAAAQIWLQVFIAGFKLYAPLFLIPTIIFKRKGSLPEIIRSSTFLGTYAGAFGSAICFFKYLAGGRDYKSIAAISGFFAGLLSILIERKSRRSELALYCLNQTLEIMWKMAATRGFAFYIKNGEVLVFMIASAILMYFFQHEPDSLRSNMNGLLKFFIGSN